MNIYPLLTRGYVLSISNDKDYLYAKNAMGAVSMGLDFFKRGVPVEDLNRWYGVDGWWLETPAPEHKTMTLRDVAYALADLDLEAIK